MMARALLGLVFFVGGLHKVFTMGPVEHARSLFVVPYANTILPIWSLWASGTIIPFFELACGALVMIGLWTRPSLLVLGAILVIVTFGHLLLVPSFVANYFILPRSGLLLFVWLMPRDWDLFSVDAMLRKNSQLAPST